MIKIGLIPLYDDDKKSLWMLPGYMEIIEKCGALPIMLPLTKNNNELDECFKMCDGFLFTGGHDVNPFLYNESKSKKCGIPCDDRDYMETYILKKAMDEDKPVLGICRGIQIMNAILGGTLYQDIPSEHPSKLTHQMIAPYDRGVHKVKIIENTRLSEIIGTGDYEVNSYHHQAIKDLADGLKTMAVAEDGLIEAIDAIGKKFIVGVQWHPEFIYSKDDNSIKLVQAFVDACK